MAIPVFETHPAQAAWGGSGGVNLELSPKPYTITRMLAAMRTIVTTTTTGPYNDYWDRILSQLNCIGKSKTYFAFTNMRVAQHFTRMQLGPLAGKRVTSLINTSSSVTNWVPYLLHFGVAPRKVNTVGALVDNPYDLTAGIPPSDKGNLTLGGSYAAATATGSGSTVNDAPLRVFLWGLRPEAGDTPDLFQPRALPIWQQRTPTPTATSGALATQDNIAAGDFLKAILGMTTGGANAPRSDQVLNSMQVYSQLEGREIWTVRGFDASANDWKPAEIASQLLWDGYPGTDDPAGTAGTISIADVSNQGIWFWDAALQANKGNPMFGADLRGIATGDLQLRFGVSSISTITLDFLYQKYQLNPDAPQNQGN